MNIKLIDLLLFYMVEHYFSYILDDKMADFRIDTRHNQLTTKVKRLDSHIIK